jgi:ribosome-binding factor A
MRLRHVPDLGFALDDAFDNADRIAALLHSEAVERDLQDKDGG